TPTPPPRRPPRPARGRGRQPGGLQLLRPLAAARQRTRAAADAPRRLGRRLPRPGGPDPGPPPRRPLPPPSSPSAPPFPPNFIPGFPGGRAADVRELEAFLEAARLDWVAFFAWSPEDGTAALELDDRVPEATAGARVERAQGLQDSLLAAAQEAWVG